MQLLPHEVADLQPVLDLLSKQDPTDIEVRLTLDVIGKCVFSSYRSCLYYLCCSLSSSMFDHVLIPDLGNALHAVAMAFHDLPHSLWPFSPGWQYGVKRWKGQRVHYGAYSIYFKGKLSIWNNLDFVVVLLYNLLSMWWYLTVIQY